MKYTFLDFETTGKSPMNCEIMSGFAVVTDFDLKEIRREHFKFRAEQWNEEAFEIHGITLTENESHPPFEQEFKRFMEWCPESSILVCHSNYEMFGVRAYFDASLIKQACLRMDVYDHSSFYKKFPRWLSTHTIMKDLHKKGVLNLERKVDAPFYGLSNLCKNFDIPLTHHNDESDTLACIELFRIAKNCLESNFHLNHFLLTKSAESASLEDYIKR